MAASNLDLPDLPLSLLEDPGGDKDLIARVNEKFREVFFRLKSSGVTHDYNGLYGREGKDVKVRLYDSAGGRKFGIYDGADAEVAYVDSDGGACFDGDICWESGTGFAGTLAHANTAARTYTFPDSTGTVGLLGVIDHGADLTGLLDDDHTIYLKADGTRNLTGNLVVTALATIDTRDLSVDGAKLDGIESGATADQTAAEILTALLTVDGSGSGLDADLLDGNSSAAFALASHAHAASDITTGLLALARGGTNADLSATGGASQVLRQSSAGAAITVSQIDHGADLAGLLDDDHTQYALLAGRAGGQTLIGGTGASDTLILKSDTAAPALTLNNAALSTAAAVAMTLSAGGKLSLFSQSGIDFSPGPGEITSYSNASSVHTLTAPAGRGIAIKGDNGDGSVVIGTTGGMTVTCTGGLTINASNDTAATGFQVIDSTAAGLSGNDPMMFASNPGDNLVGGSRNVASAVKQAWLLDPDAERTYLYGATAAAPYADVNGDFVLRAANDKIGLAGGVTSYLTHDGTDVALVGGAGVGLQLLGDGGDGGVDIGTTGAMAITSAAELRLRPSAGATVVELTDSGGPLWTGTTHGDIMAAAQEDTGGTPRTAWSWNPDTLTISLAAGAATINADTAILDMGGRVRGQELTADGDIGGVASTTSLTNGNPALGAGAAATLGTIGGTGPATAAQNSWIKVYIGTTAAYLPVWT